MAGKFGIKQYLTSSGVFAPDVDIISDDIIRLVVNGANPSNNITLYGRIVGQEGWTIVGSLLGNGSKDFSVSLFDFVRLECVVFSAINTRVDLAGSGFEVSSGLSSVITPTGTLTEVQNLQFESSDSSVLISLNGDKVNLRSASSSLSKYTKNLILSDWGAPTSGVYLLTIPFSFHGISNPNVSCYELDGSDLVEVLYPIEIDNAFNITITASQVPDSRFLGKIIID